MAYKPNTWADGDVITAEKLNALEQGVGAVKDGAVGPKGETGAAGAKGDTGAKGETGAAGKAGANGKDGLSIKAIALKTTDGKVTSGEATLSDDSKVAITVTTA